MEDKMQRAQETEEIKDTKETRFLKGKNRNPEIAGENSTLAGIKQTSEWTGTIVDESRV